jgi:hypothetical protein
VIYPFSQFIHLIHLLNLWQGMQVDKTISFYQDRLGTNVDRL